MCVYISILRLKSEDVNSIALYSSRPTLLQSVPLQSLCVVPNYNSAAGMCQTLSAHVLFSTVYYKTAEAVMLVFLILIIE